MEYTFISAAVKILEEFNKPMSSKEVWNEIVKQNLYKSTGKTPEATLNKIMLSYSHNSNIKSKFKTKKFHIVEYKPIKFVLLNNVEKEEPIKEVIIEKEYIYFCDTNYNILKCWVEDNEVHFELTDIKSYTYVLYDKYNGYKIGRTSNTPIDRLKQLKTSNPNLEIDFVLPFENNENRLHKEFDKYRKEGSEFFFPVKEIKDWVEKENKKINKLNEIYNRYLSIKSLKDENLKDYNTLK